MADDEQNPQEDQSDNLKDLRAAAADGRKARTEAEEAKRELAFVKAGIDTDSTAGKMFMKFYEGELDADAIKAGYSELGIGPKTNEEQQTQQQPQAPVLSPQELMQSQLRGALASEAGVPGDGSVNPWDRAYEAFNEAKADGARAEQAAAAALAHIFGAANAGDQRVIYREPLRSPQQ